MISATQDAVAAPFVARGLPVFTTENEAIHAMAQLVAHTELMARTKVAARSRFRAVPGDQAKLVVTLNEAESLAIVAKAGIAVAEHELCRTAEACVTAWRKIGGPVVLKGCSRDAPHKSELGLVRLGLDAEQSIVETFAAMTNVMRDNGLRNEGVIVAAIVKGQREMMIGAHRDPLFGPVIVVGDGGKYVEALGDVRVLLPPFTAKEVELALRRLRIAPLLDGVRGEPPLDVASFCQAAVRIGALMIGDTKISSLDLNPAMVGAAGEGCCVVDALVVQERSS
jgi:acyl-CoA synthetase (NDP forming)